MEDKIEKSIKDNSECPSPGCWRWDIEKKEPF